MAKSIICRGQGVLKGTNDTSELLQAGFTQKTFRRITEQYPHHPSTPTLKSYITTSVNSIASVLSNATDNTHYPLDRFSNGNALLTLSLSSQNASYLATLTALRNSLDLQPRNAHGGLFYFTYPFWSYLDGMYSLTPFYVLYATLLAPDATAAAVADATLQLDLLWDRCKDDATGLLVHGYDDSRTAVWAGPVTGASPHVWGRSLGWYLMALVDTVEALPSREEGTRTHLLGRFRELARAVVEARDRENGVWWQVLDQPGREGNYLESSGSAMFVYALLRGLRSGYLGEGEEKAEEWTEVAIRAYGYLVDEFVVDAGNGTLGYNGTVSVCSLNSTASYEYYVTRPILFNSVLGSNAFILASLEYENLIGAKYGGGIGH
ncbi:Mitochondrial import inner membrane translocase subunit tim50 [Elsinoe australis]|uniref:Mitochondrial import inner membrane translocase subunit tim50 n=1 Tax=Elsinoe australis TaxID=40998 RepID=A0A2P7Z1M2_9PEZI|nr:Mitochondrial import inner membrane translocase subunit tim50 [Elsinoe australis]